MGNVRDEVAKNLLYYRKKSKLTQKYLAQILNVTNTSVSNWETGLNAVDMDTLHEICKLYNISMNDIFGNYANERMLELNNAERDFITKFRELDDRGKKAVDDVLRAQYLYLYPADTAKTKPKPKAKNELVFMASNGGDAPKTTEISELDIEELEKAEKIREI